LKGDGVQTCSWGINFAWFDARLLVFGFLLPSDQGSAAHSKATRQYPRSRISLEALDEARQRYAQVLSAFAQDIEARKQAIIQDYVQSHRYEEDFLARVRPEIQRSLSITHDYRQFVARIRQLINVVLETRYPGVDLDQKLGRAFPSETAIYWAAALREEKLQTTMLLLNLDRMNGLGEEGVFRLHGLVTKYLRIYQASFDERGVRLRTVGVSVGSIRGVSKAVGVIPHTLIDNALKYSKRDSEVEVEFRETEREITLSVSSLGPRIAADERDKIFDVFYRGRDAKRQEEEGAGFGLYLAQLVATRMGTSIRVEQEGSQTSRFGHRTRFSVTFLRES
jgi:signal transduction histidine kinase